MPAFDLSALTLYNAQNQQTIKLSGKRSVTVSTKMINVSVIPVDQRVIEMVENPYSLFFVIDSHPIMGEAGEWNLETTLDDSINLVPDKLNSVLFWQNILN